MRPAGSHAHSVSAWPLIGRDGELASVAACLGQTDLGGVVVAGPAGVGKSRLAGECALTAERRGLRSRRVVATRSTRPIPFGALAPLLPPFPSRLELRADLLVWAAEAIIGEAAPRLVLVVDDAHLLDDGSAIVVHQLAQSGQVFVVATLRSGEGVPDPIHALWKDDLAPRVELGPLSRTDFDELLDQVLEGPVDGACRRDLWAATAGNPMLLRELLAGATEAGVLARAEGVWQLTGSLAVTPRLVELVESRLTDLDAAAREALALLAVGEPLELGVLAGLADPLLIDRLEGVGLLDISNDGPRSEVRLAHPLFGDVLRAGLTQRRAEVVNRTLADAYVAAEGLDPATALRVAVWRLDGGGRVDPALMLAAAYRAYFAHDDELACRLARRALEKGAGLEAGVLLAQVLGQLGRHVDRCELDVELARDAISEEERVMVAVDHSIGLFWGQRQGEAAVAVLGEAAEALEPGRWRDEVIAQRSTFELLSARFGDAVALAQPIFDRSQSGRAVATAAVGLAPALAVMGRGEQAIAVAERALGIHLSLGKQTVLADPGIHLVSRVLAMCELGRLADARDAAHEGYDLALGARSKTGHGWFTLMLGRIGLATGQLARAHQWFAEGAVIYRALGNEGPRRWCLAGQVIASAARDERDSSDAALDALDRVPPQPMLMMEPDVVRARAWNAVARGDLDAAGHWLGEAARLAEATGALALAMTAWHDLARLGFEDDALPHLSELAPQVSGPLAPIRLQHVTAQVAGDTSGLAAAADGFEQIGALLLAAESAASASAAAHREGRARLAARHSQRALSLAAQCDGARTPILRLAGQAKVLTRREREVAELAAAGLASKAIAARLGLAVRTVDNHLLRAYEKIGVASRADLAEALTPAGLGGAPRSNLRDSPAGEGPVPDR